MFQPSENAHELFRRLTNRSIELKIRPNKPERFKFGEIVEIQAVTNEIDEAILGTAIEFASQTEDGLIIHVSTGNNLFCSILESKINLSSTALYRMHLDGRVKSIVVQNLLQLLAAAEFLRSSLASEKTLLLLDGLSTLLLAQKSSHSALIQNTLKSITELCQFKYVLAIWINSVTSRSLAGLRDGTQSTRDSLSISWKQNVGS